MNSLAEIDGCARKTGFFPVAAQLRIASLPDLPVPAILHVQHAKYGQRGHYLVFVGLTPESHPILLDPPLSPTIVHKNRIGEKWTGNSLILCKSAAEEGKRRSELRWNAFFSGCGKMGHRCAGYRGSVVVVRRDPGFCLPAA
jgi:ABC-type bacteriocin/lantibiotic exporter with double-glycine peptidase domain